MMITLLVNFFVFEEYFIFCGSVPIVLSMIYLKDNFTVIVIMFCILL